MDFRNIVVRPIEIAEEPRFQKSMQEYHYLGALPKIGNTIRYVATYQDDWLSLIVFSAAALKCGARDNWIGWKFRYQYDRLNLLANNSRFLILPDYHLKNLASKILSLCQRRIQNDWIIHFGYPLLLLETFVDPTRFHGTIYKASNWNFVGNTKGYQRIRSGYSDKKSSGKMVFVCPLQRDAAQILSHPILEKCYHTGGRNMKLSADQMKSLPDFFRNIKDPRRGQGRRHSLHVVLGISAAAILCGMAGYKEISDWAKSLGQKARSRFQCRRQNKKYIVPSESTIRNVLIRVDPKELDRALQQWNETYGATDESLAIDGKTMCNAIDKNGRQTHIMSAIGHQSGQCYTQKKLVPSP